MSALNKQSLDDILSELFLLGSQLKCSKIASIHNKLSERMHSLVVKKLAESIR